MIFHKIRVRKKKRAGWRQQEGGQHLQGPAEGPGSPRPRTGTGGQSRSRGSTDGAREMNRDR